MCGRQEIRISFGRTTCSRKKENCATRWLQQSQQHAQTQVWQRNVPSQRITRRSGHKQVLVLWPQRMFQMKDPRVESSERWYILPEYLRSDETHNDLKISIFTFQLRDPFWSYKNGCTSTSKHLAWNSPPAQCTTRINIPWPSKNTRATIASIFKAHLGAANPTFFSSHAG